MTQGTIVNKILQQQENPLFMTISELEEGDFPQEGQTYAGDPNLNAPPNCDHARIFSNVFSNRYDPSAKPFTPKRSHPSRPALLDLASGGDR
jgi:hypothetical protein